VRYRKASMETYCVDVTVNLMTYFPCKAAGTQCNRPRELSFFNKRSVKVFSPRRRKTTMPRCRAAGISKRASAKTKASNFCANLTPYVNAYSKFTLHSICIECSKLQLDYFVVSLRHCPSNFNQFKQALISRLPLVCASASP